MYSLIGMTTAPCYDRGRPSGPVRPAGEDDLKRSRFTHPRREHLAHDGKHRVHGGAMLERHRDVHLPAPTAAAYQRRDDGTEPLVDRVGEGDLASTHVGLPAFPTACPG